MGLWAWKGKRILHPPISSMCAQHVRPTPGVCPRISPGIMGNKFIFLPLRNAYWNTGEWRGHSSQAKSVTKVNSVALTVWSVLEARKKCVGKAGMEEHTLGKDQQQQQQQQHLGILRNANFWLHPWSLERVWGVWINSAEVLTQAKVEHSWWKQ